MSERTSLRDFQEALSRRLRAAATEAPPSARLGFEAGGESWLARLDRAGEVLRVPEIQRVPLTQEWFLGVANIRGSLYGISDLGAFLGRAETARGPENRLLLVGQPLGMNCALLVSRVAGLRNVGKYVTEPATGVDWSTAAWRDKEGRVWRELDTDRLLAQRAFLDIAAH